MDQSNKVIPFPGKEAEESQDSQEYREIRLVPVSRMMERIFSEDLDEENVEGKHSKREPVTGNDEV